MDDRFLLSYNQGSSVFPLANQQQVVVCNRLHASILTLLMDIPHVILDGGPNTPSYGKRMGTRTVAFETSEHCNQDSLRYRDASTLEESIGKALDLLNIYFGEN